MHMQALIAQIPSHTHSLTQTNTMDGAAGPLSPTLNTQVSPQHRECVFVCVNM